MYNEKELLSAQAGFRPRLDRSRPATANEELQFFAIVGVGRSGTTLLMSMLNAHSAMALPPEFHFVNQHIAQAPTATLPEAKARLEEDSRFARLGTTVDEAIRPFSQNQSPFSMPNLYREILKTYAARKNVAIIGDKAPKYVEYLPILRQLFPKGKIIHLIRDPRDVYLSRAKAAWSASRRDNMQFLAYRAQYALGRRLGPQLFGDNYLETYYEQLLTQPETELKRICHFIGVPFQSEMLAFSSSAQNIVFPDEMAWKKEALGPLLTNNMNKWRQKLPPDKIARIESACTPTFKDGFYQRSEQSNNRPNSVKYALLNGYMAILSALYQGAIKAKNRQVLRKIR